MERVLQAGGVSEGSQPEVDSQVASYSAERDGERHAMEWVGEPGRENGTEERTKK
jgi:hypothetical protein